MSESEIEKFAKWFHQDFGIIFDDINDGVKTYLGTLNDQRQKILSKEISVLLAEYPGKSHKGVKNAWIRLGAQWWNKEMPNILQRISK